MKTEPSPPEKKPLKSRTYFTIAFVVLFLMGLSWSVDLSMVYLLFGTACFFLFLGAYHLPKNMASRESPRSRSDYRNPRVVSQSLGAKLSEIFGARKDTSGNRPLKIKLNIHRLIPFVGLGIFLIFVITIVITVLTSDVQSNASFSYYDEAERYYLEQEYDSAKANYRRALAGDPDYGEALVGYGKVLTANNELDSAIAFFDKALTIDPGYKEASYQKALVLYDQKRYREGIAILNSVVDINPDYYEASLLLGDFYYIQQNYDDAIIWYEKAYSDGGMRSRILCHIMAYIYDVRGEYDKAISLYQEALSYDSTVVDIYKRLGELIPDEDGRFYRSKAIQLTSP